MSQTTVSITNRFPTPFFLFVHTPSHWLSPLSSSQRCLQDSYASLQTWISKRIEKNKPTDKEVSNKQIQDNHKVSNSLVFYYPGFIEKLIFTAPSVKFENEIVITESLSYIKNMIPKENNITNDLVLFKD